MSVKEGLGGGGGAGERAQAAGGVGSCDGHIKQPLTTEPGSITTHRLL